MLNDTKYGYINARICVYEIACGSKMIYGIEIWDIKGNGELHTIRRGHFARRC
jgi:hypothetical protein